MHVELKMKSIQQLIHGRGLQAGGRTQKFIDQEVIRLMDPYTPRLNGNLIKSATLGTKIGTGDINYNVPYGRYLYYGKLMVSSITGSSYAAKGESKVLTGMDLHYNEEPMRGAFWFERMKADKKTQILRGARRVAGER
jgi:hypothetical protein